MRLRPSMLLVLASAAATLVWSAGCGDTPIDAIEGPLDGGGGPGDPGFGDPDAAAGDAAAIDGGGGGGGGDFCSGAGVAIPIPGTTMCSGDLGHKLFRFAACSCTTLDVGGAITTSAFNSSTGASSAVGASIGANGKLTSTGSGTIGGSAYAAGAGVAAGATAIDLTGGTTMALDLWSGRNVQGIGGNRVKGDAYVNGTVSGLPVEGKLHTPTGQANPGGGGAVAGPVSVAPPCECEKKLDIKAIVAPFKTTNDNAAIDLSPDALADGGTLTLPCGRYYLTKMNGSVTLNLKGRTAIFVDGDIDLSGSISINLDPGAEIDIFASGNFRLSGSAKLGSLEAPSKVRVYTAGPNFDLAGSAELGGNFYAPNANLALASGFKMSGAIFGNKLNFAGGFDIRYDEAILSLEGCEAPGGGCTSCNDCPAAAPSCNGGTCGACATNADCCAPLVCEKGSCITVVK